MGEIKIYVIREAIRFYAQELETNQKTHMQKVTLKSIKH
jgi:hypothetical protein